MTTFADPTFTANYQGLCNKIADTLNRQDLTSVIPDFTVLATSRIQRDLARLRHPLGIQRAIASVQNNYVPLPIDYISVYQMMDQDTSISLSYLTPDQSITVQSQGWNPDQTPLPVLPPYYSPTGINIYYTIIGNTIRIIPPPNVGSPTTLDLWYFAALPALGTGNPTNWALTHYPDLYLYGSLAHTAPYLKNDERINVWEGIYQKILSDIEVEADRAIRPQSKLVSARRSF
jgi:hypothetical protein